MKKKSKSTLLTLALVPAAIAAIPQDEVKAAELDSSPVTSIAQLKEAIYSNLRAYNTNFKITYHGNTSELSAETSKIFEDLQTDRSMTYVAGTYAGAKWSTSKNSSEAHISFEVEYHSNAENEKVVDREVKRIASEILTDDMSDFDKIKAINDYVVLNTTYSKETNTSAHAAYTILNEGKGVCQAYALLTYRLLQEANIDAYYVTGVVGVEGHAWNLVKLDDEWYHLDTTWNDPVFSADAGDNSDYVRYKYFLIPDATIKKDHIIDDKGYPIATSEKYMALSAVEKPVIIDSKWYFANLNDNIQLYMLDSKNLQAGATKISDTRVQHLVHHDSWLYFANYSNGGYLSKMKLDGSQLEILERTYISSLKIVDNDLVYTDKNGQQHKKPLKDPAIVNQEAANLVITMIQQIDKNAATYFEDVANARSAFNALTEEQQLLVTNTQLLQQYEADIKATNEAVAAVITAIALLDEDSEDFAAHVQAAQAAFDALTPAQQNKVTNKEALTTAQTQVTENNRIAQTLINAIKAIDTNNATYYEQTTAARTQYEQLSAPQKKLITTDILSLLIAAETQKAQDEQAVFNLNYSLTLLDETVPTFKETITALLATFANLTDVQKTLVAQVNTLHEAEATHARYISVAQQFEMAVNSLNPQADTFKATIEQLTTQLNEFNLAQQAYISDEMKTKLANYAAQIATDSESVDVVVEQIKALENVTAAFVAHYAAALEAYNALTPAQQALVSNADALLALASTVEKIQTALTALTTVATTTYTTIEAYELAANEAKEALQAVPTAYKIAVTNASVLTNAQTIITNVKAVTNAIAALTVSSTADEIAAVKASYATLTKEEQAFVANYVQIEAIENQIAANRVDAAIAALNEASPTFFADVAQAEAAYLSLTPAQQALVTKKADLEAAKIRAAEMTQSIDAAAKVMQLIAKIDVTALSFRTDLQAAKDAFAALSVEDQAYVTNANLLKTYEQTLAAYEQDAAAFEAQVTALDVTLVTFRADVETANKAFHLLNAVQQSFIAEKTLATLTQYVEDLQALATLEAQILTLNAAATTYYSDVAAVVAAVNALNANYQALLSAEATEKLKEAKATVLADEAAANQVMAIIGQLTTNSSTEEIYAVRAAYNALTANQKQLVTNIHTLVALEAAITNSGDASGSGDTSGSSDNDDTAGNIPTEGGSENSGDTSGSGNTGGSSNTGDTSGNTSAGSGSENSGGNSGGAGGSSNTGNAPSGSTVGPAAPSDNSAEAQPEQKEPTKPTTPQIVQDGDLVNITVPIEANTENAEPIQLTASENVRITIPVNALTEAHEGATIALSVKEGDGTFAIQATLANTPVKFATYVEIELSNIPENAVLLRVDENGNKVATPFTIVDGNYVIKTMTSGEFIVSTDEKTFDDVENDGHKDYIEALAKRHIVFGATDESFNPTAGISRAQFATMVARAMGLQPESSTEFKDVEGKWFADSVQALYEAGIVNGKSDTAFDPDETLTRQQVTLMITRLLAFSNIELPKADVEAVPFTDFNTIPKAYQEAVAQVYALGIFSGKSDGAFDPQGKLTRSQMAKVLYKTLELAKML